MENTNRLSPIALGLSLGCLWALSVILMAVLAMTLGYGVGFVQAVGTVYWGYTSTLWGMFIGAGIAFLDGFIGGSLVALFYNCFAKCTCKK